MKLLLCVLFSLPTFAAGPPQHAPWPYFDGRTNCGPNVGAASYALASFVPVGSGQGSLEVGFSTDQINWCYPLIQVGTSIRDPRVLKNSGTYYLISTTGGITSWGCQTSTDFVSWSAVTAISVTGGGLAPSNTWAPTWFTDTDGSIHVISAIATTGFTNFQMYEQHPTGGANFCTGTWSNPSLITITGMTSVIDPWVTCRDSGNNVCTSLSTGKTYYIFYTICCASREFGQYASATTLTGTYTNVGTGNWAGWLTTTTDIIEGLQVIQISGAWRAFFDYLPAAGFAPGQIYYSDSTDNWVTWSTKQPIATAPWEAKHGQILSYP